MSLYTIALNEVVEKDTNTFIGGTDVKVFDFDYVYFDDTKKEDFEVKFLNHFRYREIGVETMEQFQHNLKCKCHEVLPFYNEVLKTALLEYDLIDNYDMTETFTRGVDKTDNLTGHDVSTGMTTATTTNDLSDTIDETNIRAITVDESSENRNVESDTPNGLLALADITTNVYASKVNINKIDNLASNGDSTTASRVQINTGTVELTTDFDGDLTKTQTIIGSEDETYTRITKGNIGVGSDAKMLEEHIHLQKILQTALFNFFNDCEELFMQVF